MRKTNSYYIKEFRPGKWHICNLENNHPVYDDYPNGQDGPLVFLDEDLAIEYRDRLNHNTK